MILQLLFKQDMQDFEYTYDDSDTETTMEIKCEPRLKNVTINCPSSFEFKAVKNDLDRLRETQFEETILIDMKTTDTLEFVIQNGDTVTAHFLLKFNAKYPFEAPKMTFMGPKYDFTTNLNLTLNFKKFYHSEWSIRESISTIIQELINIVYQKKVVSETLEFTSQEKIVIAFLNEINSFMNTSHFEEYTTTHVKGEGTGYGKSSDPSHSGILEEKEKQKKEMFKQCLDVLMSDSDLKVSIHSLEFASKLESYIRNCSYLFVYSLKEYLTPWIQFLNDERLSKTFHEKTNFQEFNRIFENGPNLIVSETEDFINSHYYSKEKPQDSTNQMKLLRRIMVEIMDLDQLSRLDSNFRFAWSPEKFQYLKFVVFSENEPYYGGMFEFHVYFPNNYPACPPLVHLVTTAQNTVRFNPNLYENGKVCLSLLGTWSGEQWNPVINCMTHVIQAISVMILTDQPVQNEPAYSSSIYFDSDDINQESSEILMVRKYKFQIKYYTLKYALLTHLKDQSSIFYPIYQSTFLQKKQAILKSCENYLETSQSEQFSKILNAKSFQENKEIIFPNYSKNFEFLINEINELLV